MVDGPLEESLEERIADFLDGRLDPTQARALEEQLRRAGRLEELTRLQRTVAALRGLPREPVPPGLVDRILRAVAAEADPRPSAARRLLPWLLASGTAAAAALLLYVTLPRLGFDRPAGEASRMEVADQPPSAEGLARLLAPELPDAHSPAPVDALESAGDGKLGRPEPLRDAGAGAEFARQAARKDARPASTPAEPEQEILEEASQKKEEAVPPQEEVPSPVSGADRPAPESRRLQGIGGGGTAPGFAGPGAYPEPRRRERLDLENKASDKREPPAPTPPASAAPSEKAKESAEGKALDDESEGAERAKPQSLPTRRGRGAAASRPAMALGGALSRPVAARAQTPILVLQLAGRLDPLFLDSLRERGLQVEAIPLDHDLRQPDRTPLPAGQSHRLLRLAGERKAVTQAIGELTSKAAAQRVALVDRPLPARDENRFILELLLITPADDRP